jgi:hypothetical protein
MSGEEGTSFRRERISERDTHSAIGHRQINCFVDIAPVSSYP